LEASLIERLRRLLVYLGGVREYPGENFDRRLACFHGYFGGFGCLRRERSQVEQIGERRDTTLTAFIAGGERAIGFVGLPIRPSFRNEGAAAVWKRDEQELNAAPSQSPHDFEIVSLQWMALTQNLHRTREVAEMGSL
jgi:hypothetical protein